MEGYGYLKGNKELCELVKKVSTAFDTEIVLYAGPISEPYDQAFISKLDASPRRHKNTILILSTYGGSADAAYRMARALQRWTWEGLFAVLVPWKCKSAGTLLCIGAGLLIMGDEGELGPLDVQLIKKDELGEYSSGLTPMQTLATLREEAFHLFEEHFLGIRFKSGFVISTRLAAKIASEMTSGLFGQLYSQLDPLRLGQTFRSMMVALRYGERLNQVSKNLKPDALEDMISGYPSHSFVIDQGEVPELFERAVIPSDDQRALCVLLQPLIEKAMRGSEPTTLLLTDECKKLLGCTEEGCPNARQPNQGPERGPDSGGGGGEAASPEGGGDAVRQADTPAEGDETSPRED